MVDVNFQSNRVKFPSSNSLCDYYQGSSKANIAENIEYKLNTQSTYITWQTIANHADKKWITQVGYCGLMG